MNRVVIYGSFYGTTKKYAIELAKRLEVDAIDYNEVKDINKYDSIIYLGGLYAGGVLGMAKTLKKLTDLDNKELVISTVGLADPTDQENIINIEAHMKKQLSEEMFTKSKIFHLRGGIVYKDLNFKHKFMMKLVYNKAKKIPVEERNAELKAMIETYNKEVDFVNFDELNKTIDILK